MSWNQQRLTLFFMLHDRKLTTGTTHITQRVQVVGVNSTATKWIALITKSHVLVFPWRLYTRSDLCLRTSQKMMNFENVFTLKHKMRMSPLIEKFGIIYRKQNLSLWQCWSLVSMTRWLILTLEWNYQS